MLLTSCCLVFKFYIISWAVFETDIDSVDPSNDLTLFANVMEAMERCSPDASIFILIHKMDLVAEDDREREFAERSALVQSKSEQ